MGLNTFIYKEVTFTRVQSHLVIMKAKSSGSFVRYSEVSEEIPYSEVCLHGSRGVNFQKVHS